MRYLVLVFITSLLISVHADVCKAEEVLSYGRFGRITLYQTSKNPAHVVIFVSGDGGWNLGVVDMARVLASNDALVIGVDIVHYMKALAQSSETCSYPAADFELLSKFIQRKLGLPTYRIPILVGYSSGATLVYAVLVQAPPNTFLGAMSLGFCPDLLLKKPLCRGYGLEYKPGPKNKGYSFLPAKSLQSTWIAFQGDLDQVCNPVNTENFVKEVTGGKITMLPQVGHGFAVQKKWMLQFKEAFRGIAEKPPIQESTDNRTLNGLPLVEMPSSPSDSKILAIMVSGDGGWAGIDRDLAGMLSSKHVSVVGLNSLQYFWTRRTPEKAAQDLERIIRFYCASWNKDEIILIGYSLGADVLPFMANGLPKELLEQVSLIALLGPGETASFEFHLSDWLGGSSDSGALPIYPEILKLKDKKILCFYGESEEDSLCRKLDQGIVEIIAMKGGHHFGGDYTAIGDQILMRLKPVPK